MRVLILLIVLLLVACVILALYAIRLRRIIKESNNPLLALTRKQRAAFALRELNREHGAKDLKFQDYLNQTIFGTPPTVDPNRKDK